jgi:hypothetical protein
VELIAIRKIPPCVLYAGNWSSREWHILQRGRTRV